ncbi:Glutamyl-tRNA(Gln) amidotransferase subunit E [uncultured archaeon]|nr:Glutamyl-tRNA(Gln) amidotransferase subunit E [uncultured archaeon]
MTDYGALGFKCGLEIHQQLDTAKLFCPCPSVMREDAPHLIVQRKMRAVAGELGEVDRAALHEFLKGRTLHYEAYHDTNCLVELDEEPPHDLNNDALEVALTVALLLNARPVDELHVMRKTVVDGSNTTGFQRTILVAEDGFIETSLGKVGVPSICLEEDAARKISEKSGDVTYRLDRLGIPLVEIATDATIKSPEHAREVAEALGNMLRACRVKRGLGTIRQDLNVSVKGGARVEAKGVQELKLISEVVKKEVERQQALIEARETLKKRGVTEKDFDAHPTELTDLLKNTQSTILKKNAEKGGIILATKLKGCAGELKGKLGPELAGYARSLAGVGGIFHSDELPSYGITAEEVAAITKHLKLTEEDAFALVAAPKKQAEEAIKATTTRAKKALHGVPEETRRALEDGRTEFMRPLPGSARMYPETDEPPIAVTAEKIASLKSRLPELRQDKAARYEKAGLSKELAGQLAKSQESALFDELIEETKVDVTMLAHLLLQAPKEAKKRFQASTESLTDGHFRATAHLLAEGKISKDAAVELLAKISQHPKEDVLKTAEKNNLTSLSEKDLKHLIDEVKKKNPETAGNPNAILGRIMAEAKGRADPATVLRLLR